MKATLIVTGGAGFIGSNLVHLILRERPEWRVVNLDLLTYAGNLENLSAIEDDPRYRFVQGDIAEAADVERAFDVAAELGGDAPLLVAHLAAESHVDRSIVSGLPFVRTNVLGTQVLLDVSRARGVRRFLHVSTDEVYGSLGDDGRFDEHSRYDPRSPYSATKAASDHLAAAWRHTFGIPTLITNCGNNYGPYQFPEKFIPTLIIRALKGQELPIYGGGTNVRDWIHVEDHARALLGVLAFGTVGNKYLIGAEEERRNLDLAAMICDLVDRAVPRNQPSRALMKHVADRPGHDQRYAIDSSKVRAEIGWRPSCTLAEGLESTVRWYIDHKDWWEDIFRSGRYDGGRLGLQATGTRAS